MNVVELIHEAERTHSTRFAFELLPPLKGDGMEGIAATIDRLMPYNPAYINVTFHREVLKQVTLPDGEPCGASPSRYGRHCNGHPRTLRH